MSNLIIKFTSFLKNDRCIIPFKSIQKTYKKYLINIRAHARGKTTICIRSV